MAGSFPHCSKRRRHARFDRSFRANRKATPCSQFAKPACLRIDAAFCDRTKKDCLKGVVHVGPFA